MLPPATVRLRVNGLPEPARCGGLNYDPNFYWQSSIAKYIRFKNSLLLSRDGKTLLKGKFAVWVKRWDIATGQTVMEYGAHTKAVLCYDLSRDGKRLLTGGGDGRIILRDVATGDSIMSINAYREPIFDIHFNANETQVYSSSWDACCCKCTIYLRGNGLLISILKMRRPMCWQCTRAFCM